MKKDEDLYYKFAHVLKIVKRLKTQEKINKNIIFPEETILRLLCLFTVLYFFNKWIYKVTNVHKAERKNESFGPLWPYSLLNID